MPRGPHLLSTALPSTIKNSSSVVCFKRSIRNARVKSAHANIAVRKNIFGNLSASVVYSWFALALVFELMYIPTIRNVFSFIFNIKYIHKSNYYK